MVCWWKEMRTSALKEGVVGAEEGGRLCARADEVAMLCVGGGVVVAMWLGVCRV